MALYLMLAGVTSSAVVKVGHNIVVLGNITGDVFGNKLGFNLGELYM